jgi:hypothetical protein
MAGPARATTTHDEWVAAYEALTGAPPHEDRWTFDVRGWLQAPAALSAAELVAARRVCASADAPAQLAQLLRAHPRVQGCV